MSRCSTQKLTVSYSVKFAPATVSSSRSSVADGYTSSPKPQYDALRRSGTVADRTNEKLRAASTAKSLSQPGSRLAVSIDGKTLPPPPSVSSDRGSPTKDDAFIPPTEPNGKPMMPSVVPPVPRKDGSSSPVVDANSEKILLSGLSLHPNLLHDLLGQFDNHLRTTPAPHAANSPDLSSSRSQAVSASRQRSTILGTYERTFSGEEVVDWLRENIESFGGDWERCVEAASELHKMGYLSRVGVGRGFDASYDTYYTLKQNPSPSTPSILSPLSPSTSANLQSMFKSYLPGALGLSDEPAHLRLRREAAKADEAYKEGVRSAEDKRLEMEERIERGLRVWERWERERLGVIQAGA